MSPTLNVNANYKKVSRISRLPAYLTLQYVRFFVSKSRDGEEMVAKKILKVRRDRGNVFSYGEGGGESNMERARKRIGVS